DLGEAADKGFDADLIKRVTRRRNPCRRPLRGRGRPQRSSWMRLCQRDDRSAHPLRTSRRTPPERHTGHLAELRCPRTTYISADFAGPRLLSPVNMRAGLGASWRLNVTSFVPDGKLDPGDLLAYTACHGHVEGRGRGCRRRLRGRGYGRTGRGAGAAGD